jgi:hypothetical protein
MVGEKRGWFLKRNLIMVSRFQKLVEISDGVSFDQKIVGYLGWKKRLVKKTS